MIRDRINRYAKVLDPKRTNRGYCPVCEKETIFVEYNDWLRDYYRCVRCNSIPRERAVMHVMDWLVPGWPGMRLHESSPGTVNSRYIRKKCRDYSSSQYHPDIARGSYRKGVRCENLEGLTFDDESFDVFLTQDVFEHVLKPKNAFREIRRVLRPNGVHVFTVPLYRELAKSRPRAEPAGDRVVHLLEPAYHGNPIDPGGSLVTWDYGFDLPGLIYEWSGLFTAMYYVNDRKKGIDGEFLEVLISYK